MDFTIVIPHRGNSLGLWATVHSCEIDLEKIGRPYNYVIVTNGEPLSIETKAVISTLRASNKLCSHLHYDEGVAPPYARQRGVEKADGDILFFFDNHCLVTPKYFERALLDFENPEIDCLHATTKFFTADSVCYEYRMTLDYNFWGESKNFAESHKPYKIAMSGHGAMAVRRSVFNEVGGYGPEGVLDGYGGEEPMFDLKLWRYGKKVWIDPKLNHYHYAGNRGYSRHYTDAYYTNMLSAAHVIGGEKWLYKVFDSIISKVHLKSKEGCTKTEYDWLMDAYYRSAQYAKEVNEKSKFTLDDLLFNFKRDLVSY